MTLRSTAALRQHVLDLGAAFGVQVVEARDLPPEGAAASPTHRLVVCAPITDETLYAVALHELGHVLAPSGALPGVEGLPARVRVAEEEAAWEWARHYALEWSPAMEQVATWALSTYTAAVPQLPTQTVPWDLYAPGRRGRAGAVVGLPCPACGASLTLDATARVLEEYAVPYHVIGHPIPTRLRRATVASCDRCEWAAEWDPRRQRLDVLT